MSVAIGRSPFDILEIYVNRVMGGAHCSTFVSAQVSLWLDGNIIYASAANKLFHFEILYMCSFFLFRSHQNDRKLIWSEIHRDSAAAAKILQRIY